MRNKVIIIVTFNTRISEETSLCSLWRILTNFIFVSYLKQKLYLSVGYHIVLPSSWYRHIQNICQVNRSSAVFSHYLHTMDQILKIGTIRTQTPLLLDLLAQWSLNIYFIGKWHISLYPWSIFLKKKEEEEEQQEHEHSPFLM